MARFVWLSFDILCILLILEYGDGNIVTPSCKASEKSCTFNLEARHEWTMTIANKIGDHEKEMYDFSALKLEGGKLRRQDFCHGRSNFSFLTPEGELVCLNFDHNSVSLLQRVVNCYFHTK